ncbi:hypothetical protein LCGC14_1667810 [marine sediment metagenome]|uniref:Uncharacterized protein n=1 Tax=marine sediment metagenome TaxID=412755 RepID=A0A0F9IET2_9ZZZZ
MASCIGCADSVAEYIIGKMNQMAFRVSNSVQVSIAVVGKVSSVWVGVDYSSQVSAAIICVRCNIA